MNNTNVILLKVSRLEELPNEMFLLIFSYLKSDMVIQTFLNLNQRFQSLIHQFTRHLVLTADIKPAWIEKYMLSIMNDIETITLSVHLIDSVFSWKYSYPYLRSITMYLNIEWQVELDIENDSPVATLISVLNVLEKCSFERVKRDFSKIFRLNHMTQPTGNIQTTEKLASDKWNDIDHVSPCSAIQRVSIWECDERNLWNLCDLAPELTYLKIWLRPLKRLGNYSVPTPTPVRVSTRLTELYIKVIDLQSFKDVKLLLAHYQASLRRLSLDLGQDLMIDGRKLEALLAPYTSLEDISFICQISNKQFSTSNLLSSFQSEWWLDIRRPTVLIHETDFDYVLAMSIPCSFPKILKHFQFSSDLRSWHLNKGQLASLSFGSLKMSKVCFSSNQPISVDFLQFTARIFYSPKQALSCRFWGLMFEEELFKQLMDQSMAEIILPNVTRLKITHVNGLSPLTLAVWLLLAPNVRMLEIEYLTFSELMEWIIELKDALIIGDQRFKMIFQRIRRITVSSVCYNWHEKLRLQIYAILTEIFSSATID